MPPLLRIKNLSILFPGQPEPAVKQLSLELAQGEILGLVGESGSGKSLTAFSIVRLLPPQALIQGEIFWKENTPLHEASGKNAALLRGRNIGFVFQEPMSALNPTLTCGYQIAEMLITHQGFTRKKAKDETIALLKEVQIPDPERVFSAYPHEISGGQRQRVMIAMALSTKPELLLADEPTTALDASLQKSMAILIKDLCRARNMACIFISHDLHLVRNLADRTGVMLRGSLVEIKPNKLLFENPTSTYTRGLLACSPGYSEKKVRLPFYNSLSQQIENPIPNKPDKPEEEVLLKVAHLHKIYQAPTTFPWQKPKLSPVLLDCQFLVRKGGVLNIVGESGSGKSTIARILVRLMRESSGEIWFGDVPLHSLSTREFWPYRKKTQMIFQDPNAALNPRNTIRQILLEPMQIHRLGNQSNRLTDICNATGIQLEWLNRYPFQLSGGQRQRVSIARSLILQPDILICDESVSALDLSLQARVLNLLKDLQQQFRFGMIFITHDLTVARFLGGQTLVLEKGMTRTYGETSEILTHPSDPYTRKLVENASWNN